MEKNISEYTEKEQSADEGVILPTTKYTHNHHADGGYHPTCKRCRLDSYAPELLKWMKVLIARFDPNKQHIYSLAKAEWDSAHNVIAKIEGE